MDVNGINFNPSSVLCYPDETAITVDGSFSYVFDTYQFNMAVEQPILYNFNFRRLYENYGPESIYKWGSVIEPDYMQSYYIAKDKINDPKSVNLGDIISIKASDILSDTTYIGGLQPPYPDHMDWMYNKKLQWRVEYGVKFDGVLSNYPEPGESFPEYTFAVKSGDELYFKQVQNGSLIYYNSMYAGITTQAYGYISKRSNKAFRIYRYREGAINANGNLEEYCLKNTNSSSVTYIKTVNYSNWMNFKMMPKETLSFLNPTDTIKSPFYTFTASISGSLSVASRYKLLVYNDNKNLIYESDYQYKALIDYSYDSFLPNKTYFIQFIAYDTNGLFYDTGLVQYQSTDFLTNEISANVLLQYTCGDDKVVINWINASYFLSSSDYYLYRSNISTGTNTLLKIYSYLDKDFSYTDMGVVNLNQYTYYIIDKNVLTTGNYKKTDAVDIKYSSIFFDDIENGYSYKIKLMVSGGEVDKKYKTSEVPNDLKYPSYTKTLNNYIEGSVNGLLIRGVSLDDNKYVKKFREFMASKRPCYYKDRDGNIFSVVISSCSESILDISVREQAMIVSISFIQRGGVII